MGGKIDKAKGHVKETVGKAVGNERLQREGRRDKAVGSAKEGVGKVKSSVEKGLDKAKRALDEGDRARTRQRARR
jgi:uncharacterized protein YjbJ (UPF0337 family)